jgi:Kelch motif
MIVWGGQTDLGGRTNSGARYNPATDTWTPTSTTDAPRARRSHSAVWTGTEMIVWGGERPGRSPEGAAYDPATDTWRRISRSPLVNRTEAASAWTGREVLVWGGVNGGGRLRDGAAYDPGNDRWRMLPPGPLDGRVPLASAWTGTELVLVGSKGYGFYDGITDTAAYDPRSDTWRLLPAMPVQINEGSGAWTGRELVVYGGFLDRNRSAVAPNDRADGAALDPQSGLWRRLPEAPLSGQAVVLAWNGVQLVGWDYELASGSFDPATEIWSGFAPLPLEKRDCLPAGVAVGRVVFAVHCGQAAVNEAGDRTWRALPAPSDATGAPVWTGRELVLWLGPSGRAYDGTWIRPLAD